MNRGQFYKYSYNSCITIGSGDDADIQIESPYVQKYHAEIHFKQVINIIGNKIPIFVIKQSKQILSIGDTVRFLDVVIVYHSQFVMINNCENCKINLKKYTEHNGDYLVTVNKVNVIKKYRELMNKPTLQIQFKTFEPIQTLKQIPLIFTMGPALTMSFASLMSGLISMYNAYMQGRELIEVLPMLLLPCMMLLSTSIYHPIQRIYEKHIREKNEKRRNDKINVYLDSLLNEVIRFRGKLDKYYNMCFCQFDNICNKILENDDMLWSKTKSHDDFLWIGLGKGDCSLPIEFKNIPSQEDVYTEKVYEFINSVINAENFWIYHDFNKETDLAIVDENNTFYRQLLMQFIFYYCTKTIQILFFVDTNWKESFDGIQWIPHLRVKNDTKVLIVNSTSEVNGITKLLSQSKKVIICFIQNQNLFFECDIKDTVNIFMCKSIDDVPNKCSSMVIIEDNNSVYRKSDKSIQEFRMISYETSWDKIYIKLLNMISNEDGLMNINSTISIYSLYNIKNASDLGIQSKWDNNYSRDGVVAVIGINDRGEKIHLNLHENANGPHMMIGSTTGGGKSEFIITFIMSLATHYSPQQIQFSIIDFKGGGLADSLKSNGSYLPHIVGNITNLSHKEMERALCSFNLECKRRQELFIKMGQFLNEPSMNIDKYQNYFNKKYNLKYLAHLIVIVDEFAELKKCEPDFMKDLISMSRIGRSLGIHLILSTQKPAAVIDSEMWSNCRTKICLKVQDKQDSYEMIHQDKAFYLTQPGQFYMLVDNHCQLGKSAWANSSIYEYENQENVFIVDDIGKVIKENKYQQIQGKTQLTALIDEINKCNYEPIEKLWYDALPKLLWSKMPTISGVLGIVDDYHHKKQDYLCHDFVNNEHGIIITSNSNEKIKFLNTLLISMVSTLKNIEIFIIDPLKQLDSQFGKLSFVQYIDTSEKISNLFHILFKRKSSDKIKKILIIYQYSTFCDELDGHDILYKYLQESNSFNSLCFLFTNQVNSVHYRILSMIACRYCLANQSTTEISTIFETPNKQIVHEEDFGLIKRDIILPFRMIHTTSKDVQRVITQFIDINYAEATIIPYVPDLLVCKHRNKNVLGIDCNTYNWISLDNYTITICVSRYLFKLQEFINKHFNHVKVCTSIDEFEDFNILFEKDFDFIERKHLCNKKYIICIEEKRWNQSWVKNIYDERSLIWIGSGFKEQIIIHHPVKKDSNNNELIYILEGKMQRIRGIDEYDG